MERVIQQRYRKREKEGKYMQSRPIVRRTIEHIGAASDGQLQASGEVMNEGSEGEKEVKTGDG